ncbi:hypothetical protein M3685_15975 [Heyndrickxia oleronia]|uniref:hypothetical protein n=1 Tax=Heyndrickxia oleronia TaxID=38875 RepID=UPI00204217EF|nr:hypothetical protein [Heyndrickxia oleronia]MCM3455423.1 hypothetical protein [Heyndrickxia oleronia]
MNVEGTVQISIKDFDELRAAAKWLEEIRTQLRKCSTVDHKKINEDEWIQIINIDAEKITKIAAEYAEVEEVYEDDVIKLVNLKSQLLISKQLT